MLWILAFGAVALVGAQQTPPSQTITNVATATYIDAQGSPVNLTSTSVSATVQPASGLRLVKSASTTSPKRGDEVVFTIRATAGATDVAEGIDTIVDGQPRKLILIRDAIPAGTRFIRFPKAQDGTLLLHISGDPLHTYTLTTPSDLKIVDAVALGFPTLLAGTNRTFSFAVQLEQRVGDSFTNTAELHAPASNAGPAVTLSNTLVIAPKGAADPFGIVFDSRTGQPIAGARVTLIDASTGAPARVFDTDGKPARAIVVTGPDGRYSFPVFPPGSYRLEVLPPPGYTGPSLLPIGSLPPGRNIDTSASYGLTFTANSGITVFDIPLDRVSEQTAGLFVQKVASRLTAEVGDVVDYTVRVRNVTGGVLNDVVLDDQLPHGFVLVEGSARKNGSSRLKSGGGSLGPRIRFGLGVIDKDEIVTVSYRLRIGPDARRGDGVNRAQASNSGSPRVSSNVASVRVQIEEGVFTTRGVVFGKVFIDANANRIQDDAEAPGKNGLSKDAVDASEPGIPGVRIYMEDGSYVITDGEGKFSFYGVTPRLHVLKLDRTTLPSGAEIEPLDNRNRGTPSTRFVDLKNAEMHKANFAVTNASPEFRAKISKLRAAAAKLAREADVSLKTDLSREGRLQNESTDRKSLAPSGVIVPGVSVQPTQDTRTKGGESLILGGDRLNLFPAGTKDARRPAAPLFEDFSSRNSGSSSALSSGQTAPSGVFPPPSSPAAPVPAQAPRPAPPESSTPSAMVVPAAPSAAVAQIPQAAVVENAPSQAATAATTVFEPVLPEGRGEGGLDLTLFDTDRQPPIPVSAVPLEESVAIHASASAQIPSANAARRPAPKAGTLAFLDLRDGDTLPMAQTAIRVQGTAGAKLLLTVNGKEVPAFRAGKRVTDTAQGVEAVEYIGVPLEPGANTLVLTHVDGFGNARGAEKITVTAPDKLGRIRIILPGKEVAADGRTPARVNVELTDAAGVPVTARTEITLEASLGQWNVKDLNPTSPGVQTFIENGHAEFDVLSPLEPGDCKLRVSAGVLRADERLAFLPDLRPMLAAGLFEGRLALSNFSGSRLPGKTHNDGFEDQLRELSVGAEDSTGSARAAFFLKGRIAGDYLLTASYDSERDINERLFRDIQPDEFYPVYGDSSVKGYEAQSTGPLYVRIDNKRSYLLYGDFLTQPTGGDFRQLGNYSRSLTGAKEHFENSRVSANAWASYDSTKQVVEEQRANGTSGPYLFNLREGRGLTNSEKVEIITRDRNNPGLIIKTETRTRFSDYELEPFTGRILFRGPVASLDEQLNPVSIRVTYEADTGGPKFWTYGGDAQLKVTERFEIGGAFAREENPDYRFSIYSANTVVQLGPKTYLMGEWARTDDELLGIGDAYRGELRHLGDKVAGRIFWGRAEAAFHNPSALLQAGRTEGGAQIAVKLAKNTRLLIDAVTSRTQDDASRDGVAISIEQTFGRDIRLEIGGRYSKQSAGDGSGSGTGSSSAAGIGNFGSLGSLNSVSILGGTPSTISGDEEIHSARVKLTVPVPYMEGRARIFGEYEQDVEDSEKRVAAIGGEYQVDAKTRLYARHELISSLLGPFDLNTLQEQNQTIVGVESTYAKDSQLFNEYRANNGISGRQSEAAIGLRNLWPLAPGLRASTSFERVAPIGKTVLGQESTAITAALEYTDNPDWKGTARVELRQSDNTESILNTLGVAMRINEDWTALGKSVLYFSDNKAPDAGDQVQARVQIGASWRPVASDRWNALGKYEFRTEDDQTNLDFDTRRYVQIISVDVNYQPNANMTLSGHYAAKLAVENSNSMDSTTSAHLISARVIRDITKRWDVGLSTNVLFDSENGLTFGVGPEIGFLVTENLRVAVGYNLAGFHDRDLSESNYTERGFYVGVRFKFDEDLWQRRERGGRK